MFRLLQLRLARLYERLERPALARKTVKILSLSVKLLEVWFLQGAVCAHHYGCQQYGIRTLNWPVIRRHQEKRLNILLKRRQGLFSAFARVAGIGNLHDITYETIGILESNEKFDFKATSLDAYLDFYKYFLYFGDLRVASFFREQALQASLREQRNIPYLLPCALRAALEVGEPEIVLDLLSKKDTSTVAISTAKAAKPMAHALLGDLTIAGQYWSADFSEADFKFLELVRGRSIAVVGPALPSDRVGSEIDSYDLIVRTNFRTDANLPVEFFGSRTDISYYNHAAWTTRRDSVLNAAESLRWINLKGRNDDKLLNELLPSFAGGSRVFFQADTLFFEGNPMAIPNILYDLLHFSPKCIKLFCSSFYISGNGYHPGYHGYVKSPYGVDFFSDGLRAHDPFSGFMFAKRAFQTNLILADRLGEGVLNTSCSQYASRLNEVYGGWTLGNNNRTLGEKHVN